jgi:hypothetical protein
VEADCVDVDTPKVLGVVPLIAGWPKADDIDACANGAEAVANGDGLLVTEPKGEIPEAAGTCNPAVLNGDGDAAAAAPVNDPNGVGAGAVVIPKGLR